MFNDRYGLTQAVIDGRKTMTRRMDFTFEDQRDLQMLISCGCCTPYVLLGKVYTSNDIGVMFCRQTRYQSGDVLAVAQNYHDAGTNPDYIVSYNKDGTPVSAIQSPGWNNKMFTRADLMPLRIRITGIRVERLQEISDENCLREGIMRREMCTCPASECADTIMYAAPNMPPKKTPREAFAALIDKVSGRGTWESNPYVVVYQFELVK